MHTRTYAFRWPGRGITRKITFFSSFACSGRATIGLARVTYPPVEKKEKATAHFWRSPRIDRARVEKLSKKWERNAFHVFTWASELFDRGARVNHYIVFLNDESSSLCNRSRGNRVNRHVYALQTLVYFIFNRLRARRR